MSLKKRILSRLTLKTLEDRFYVTFTLLFFISIISMQIVSFRISIQTVSNNSLENNRILLHQLVTQIDSYLSSLELLSEMIANDPYSQRFLQSLSPDRELEQQVQDRLTLALRSRDDVWGIVLKHPDGRIAHSDPDAVPAPWSQLASRPWVQQALQQPNRTVISPSYVQNLFMNRYAWVVSLVRAIDVPQLGPHGILLVDMRFTRIQELSRSLMNSPEAYSFILDRNGNYVFHPTLQLIYSGIKTEPLEEIRPLLAGISQFNNIQAILSSVQPTSVPGLMPQESQIQRSQDHFSLDGRNYLLAQSAKSGWTIVSVTSQEEIMAEWQTAQVIFAAIGLVVFLVIGWISNLMAQSITRPVHQLQTIMRSVETGEFKRAGNIQGSDEIQELAKEYDLMVTRISELVAVNAREQELKRKSDLKALQAQINPHFLYNTLDSIIWMGEMGNNQELVTMTSALAKLFRISISKGKEIIQLSHEIDHVVSYLTIQKMRYKDTFTFTLDIPSELNSCKVLKITLQPLVENAIYHGVRDLKGNGSIKIKAFSLDDQLFLEVQDNGQGMSPEEQQKLRENLNNTFEEELEEAMYGGSHASGTGVRNVHQRLRLYFGPDYGLHIESTFGVGTRIRATMPLLQDNRFPTQTEIDVL
jgi:two-component system sensor histidine kinase YesM